MFIRCLAFTRQDAGAAVGQLDWHGATINPAKPLKPTVVVCDATVPKNEAIMIDMAQETEVHIVTALRPAQVPPEVYNYLSPRKQVSYFIEASAPPPKPARPSWIKS
ncbi:MAG: hypothetical protein IPH54_22710 [Rhodoferax sp.]|nr:hypothetical protein [Rhodoferax sp.]